MDQLAYPLTSLEPEIRHKCCKGTHILLTHALLQPLLVGTQETRTLLWGLRAFICYKIVYTGPSTAGVAAELASLGHGWKTNGIRLLCNLCPGWSLWSRMEGSQVLARLFELRPSARPPPALLQGHQVQNLHARAPVGNTALIYPVQTCVR